MCKNIQITPKHNKKWKSHNINTEIWAQEWQPIWNYMKKFVFKLLSKYVGILTQEYVLLKRYILMLNMQYF
jgi:hypothetical protein